MNSKKSTGIIGAKGAEEKFLLGFTRIQVTVVWCLSPPGVGGTLIW